MADDNTLSAETMNFVKTIDKQLGEKYVVSLQDVLSDSSSISRKGNAKDSIGNLKADVNAYFDSLLKNLEDEEKRFNSELEAASELYKKVSDFISSKCQTMGVPLIRPVAVERDQDKEETIVISVEDTAIELLISRLISNSTYIADTSTTYKTYNIGSWLFSGDKNYNINVNPPSSIILNIEASRDEINFRLDSIQGRL